MSSEMANLAVWLFGCLAAKLCGWSEVCKDAGKSKLWSSLVRGRDAGVNAGRLDSESFLLRGVSCLGGPRDRSGGGAEQGEDAGAGK